MPAIHEVATLTSKGQITLPKPIRQALGVDVGGKVAFDFSGGKIIVSRVSYIPHDDPAIGRFLTLLENDIASGKNITSMLDNLVQSMLATVGAKVNLHEDIEGDVAL